jgi:hypothetical protein
MRKNWVFFHPFRMKSPEEEWPVSWEANERARLRDNLKLTFRQKMQWLEDTTDFAKKLQAGRSLTTQEMEAQYKITLQKDATP